MVIGNPHAWLIGNDVGIAVTITNTGSQDDKLVGVSSPDASTAGLYDTSMCSTPDPSNAGMGLCSKVPMRWWLIRVHETVQINGEIMLGGLVHPLAVGQTVEITLEFASASPVTMQVPVVEASVNP
jgi:copper(I)-binding protein